MKILNIIIFLFLASCSTYRHLPSKKFAPSFKSSAEDSLESLLFEMKSLLDGDSKSCEQVKELFEDERNHLRELLYVHILKSCNSSDQAILSFFEGDYISLPTWAKKYSVEELIDRDITDRNVKFKIYKEYFSFVKDSRVKEEVLTILQSNATTVEEKEYVKNLFDIHLPYQIENITRYNIFKIADDFYLRRSFDKARELYQMIIDDKYFSNDDKERAWDKLRFSYKQERDRATYLKITEKYYQYLIRENDHERFMKYGVILARIYWTRDNFEKALSVLDDILKKAVSKSHKEIIFYYYAGIYENLKKEEKAIAYYKLAYENSSPSSEHYRDIIWRIGWYYYKNQEYQKSITWFEILYELQEDSNWKVQFWLAMSYLKTNLNEKSVQLFTKIYEGDNYGFYGQFSSLFLETSLLRIEQDKSEDIFKSQIREFDWAVYLGKHSLAKDIIDLSENIANNKDKLRFYKGAKDYKNLILGFYKIPKTQRESMIDKGEVNSIFPLAYYKEFKDYNKSKIVPTELMLAIARQESAFDKDARSPADAFGLMQVIPSQASRLARKYNIPYETFYDLYDVKTIISLASLLQEELLSEFDGNFINVIASYNAGESVVKKWRQTSGLEGFEFIEEIPYRETRKYVKLVLRNYLIYKRLVEGDFKIDKSLVY